MTSFIFILFLSTNTDALDDIRLQTGAAGSYEGVVSKQACQCDLDEAFITQKSLEFQKGTLKQIYNVDDFGKAKKSSNKKTY